MNQTLAKFILNIVIRPAAYLSWWCIRILGRPSQAYDRALLSDIYGPTVDDSESRSLPWLDRNVQRVARFARVGTGSGCHRHDEAPRR